MRVLLCIACACCLLLTSACTDGESTPLGIGGFVTISGRATYDRVPIVFNNSLPELDHDNTRAEPIVDGVVELLVDGALFGHTRTDGDGRFAIQAPATQPITLQILASNGPRDDIHTWVQDDGNNIYAIGVGFTAAGEDVSQDLHAASGWSGSEYSGSRSAAPFAILDTIRRCRSAALTAWSAEAPELDNLRITWTPEISGSRYAPGNGLLIAGNAGADTDEFDEAVIAHEWSHFLVGTTSIDDSLGGPHRQGDILDETVAYSEGIANALGGMLLNERLYADTRETGIGFFFDLELNGIPDDELTNRVLPNEPPFFVDGPHSSFSIHEVLWDLFDNAPESGDDVALGLTPILRTLADDQYRTTLPWFTSIFGYLDAMKRLYPEHAADIDAIAGREKIVVSRADQDPNLAYGPRYQLVPVDDGDAGNGPEEVNVDASDRALQTYDVFGDLEFNNPLGNSNFASKLWNQQKFVTTALAPGIYELRITPLNNVNTIALFPLGFANLQQLTNESIANEVGADILQITITNDEAGRTITFSVTTDPEPSPFIVHLVRIGNNG